jgi:hypothetical protein
MSLSVSDAAFCGVMIAVAHTTAAAIPLKRSNSPLPNVWCTRARLSCVGRLGVLTK